MDPCLRKFLTIGAFRKVPSASFVSSGFQALFFGQLRICTSTSIFSTPNDICDGDSPLSQLRLGDALVVVGIGKLRNMATGWNLCKYCRLSDRVCAMIITVDLSFTDGENTCKLPGCSRPRYKEPYGFTHDFCGRTHAEMFKMMCSSSGKL